MNIESVKTHDGGEAENGQIIYFVKDGTPHSAALIIGYHDKLYKIFKSRSALIKRNNLKVIAIEVRCIVKETMRDKGRITYHCTFDGETIQIPTPVFQFSLLDKESLCDISKHINTDEIQEITIKYL